MDIVVHSMQFVENQAEDQREFLMKIMKNKTTLDT